MTKIIISKIIKTIVYIMPKIRAIILKRIISKKIKILQYINLKELVLSNMKKIFKQ